MTITPAADPPEAIPGQPEGPVIRTRCPDDPTTPMASSPMPRSTRRTWRSRTRWPPTPRSSRRRRPSANSAPTRGSYRAGRRRHRTHVRHPGAHPADRAGRARPDRPGPDRHGQDPRLRCAAAAAAGLDEAVVADEKGKLPVGRAPRALVMVPTRELCVQVTRDLHQVGKFLGLVGHLGLRRPRLRAADLRPARRRRPGRRHPGPVAGPGQRRASGARRDQGAGAGRGRRDARPRLPAGHGAGAGDGARPSSRRCCSRRRCRARS